ncbi:radical SAM family heme chaperone HemW [Candidatus Dependentiae bacterium]|nr:radical SAM family heme chaperone HemW [Candidatus Dependentiae bacterium]
MHYNYSIETKSLYIHWPFCPYKCHFCPFVAMASQDHFMHDYYQALIAEIEYFVHQCGRKMPIDTIFIGGGTPSTCPEPLLLDMFGKLRTWFDIVPGAEISIEVNPGTVNQSKLAVWKEVGISRLSVGVQSLNDEVLKKLNRLQSKDDVYQLLPQAKALFDNLSVDLIVGLPGVSNDEWRKTVNEVASWPITHVSVYFLSIHENTPLYFGVKAQKITLPCEDEVVDLYYWTSQTLKNNGFNQYEVSSFARPGYECKHNIVYWERKPYKGFGLGACSFDGARRFQNQKNLSLYLHEIHQQKESIIFSEKLTRKQIYLEKIMLGMRRSTGIALSTLLEGLTQGEQDKLTEEITRLRDNNLIILHNDHIILTVAGLAVENEIVVKLSL